VELEQQFVELLTKKIEKIVALFKPNNFKESVLDKVNIAQAVREVREKTYGLS